MKLKRMITVLLALLCVTFAHTETAKEFLSKGIEAEKKGENLQALTYYIQARTADKSLADAETRMWKMLDTMKNSESKKEVSPKQLIKLRSDWAKLFGVAADFLVTNQAAFEIRYFDVPSSIKVEKINYSDNTVRISAVISPYLRQTNPKVNEENHNFIYDLNLIYSQTGHSYEWGLAGFPFGYTETRDRSNKLKEEKQFSLSVYLLEGNKKVYYIKSWDKNKYLCKKDYTFTVQYGTSEYLDYTINGGSSEKIEFDGVPVEYSEKKLSLSIEKSANTTAAVLPAAKGIMETYAAIDYIKSIPEGKTETIKIGGSGYREDSYNSKYYPIITKLGDALRECKGKVYLDLSEMQGIENIGGNLIDYDYPKGYCYGVKDERYLHSVPTPQAFENCASLTGITLPNNLRTLGDRVFSNCPSLSEVVIPPSVMEFGIMLFEYCPSLVDLMIPSNVSKINKKAFAYDQAIWENSTFDESSIKTIYYGGTESDWSKLGLSLNKKVYYNCNRENLAELRKIEEERIAKEEKERLADEKKTEIEKLKTLTAVSGQSYQIAKNTTTQKLYEFIMNSNPSEDKDDLKPVTNVTWYDAILFCNKLSEYDGLEPCYTINGELVEWNEKAEGYRLPTVAEIKYAKIQSPIDEWHWDKHWDISKNLRAYQSSSDSGISYGNPAKSYKMNEIRICKGILSEEMKRETEKIANAEKAEFLAWEATRTERKKKHAEYAEHPEKGVPAEAGAYTLGRLERDATLKITNEFPNNHEWEIFIKYVARFKYKLTLDFSETKKLPLLEFPNCKNLVGIVIPASVTEIPANAFNDCTSLKNVYFCGSKKDWKAIKINEKGNQPFLKAKIHYDYKGE